MSKNKISFNVAEEKSARLAVLIDADNASAQTIDAILEETTKFGEAMAKRIYGNFVGNNGKWKPSLMSMLSNLCSNSLTPQVKMPLTVL